MNKRKTVIVHLYEEDWDLFLETLHADSESSAFDPELRKQLKDALDRIITYKDGDE